MPAVLGNQCLQHWHLPRPPWHPPTASTPVASRSPDRESPRSGCSSHRFSRRCREWSIAQTEPGRSHGVFRRRVDAPLGIAGDSRRANTRVRRRPSEQQASSVGSPSRGPVSSSSVATVTRSAHVTSRHGRPRSRGASSPCALRASTPLTSVTTRGGGGRRGDRKRSAPR